MSRKPRKKEEDCSQNPSAKSHRTKNQLYERVGISQKKIFLGKDALEKLAVLIRLQHGKKLDDQMVVSDVLSYCINACYNMPSLQAEVKKRGGSLKVVRSAKTPEGQRLYRYHQMAQAGDALELVEAFNAKNKRGKPYFPHTDDVMAYVDLGDICLDEAQGEEEDDQDVDDTGEWSTVEIQALRDHKAVSKAISTLNKQAFPTTKKKRSKTELNSEHDEEDGD